MVAHAVALVGVDEFFLTMGLVLLTVGLWTLIGWTALVAPGIVLLWIYVPARVPFVAGQPSRKPRSE